MKVTEKVLTHNVLGGCYLGGVIPASSYLSSLEVQCFNV